MTVEIFGVSTGIKPIRGGWEYQQEFQGQLHKIEAEDDRKLCEKVRRFRINSGLDVGDVEYDVATYIKQKSPRNDRFKGKIKYEPRANPLLGRSLFNRIKDMLLKLKHDKTRLVHQDEAEQRAKICADCPQNIRWQTKCVPCNSHITYQSQLLRQKSHWEYDDKLNACRLHNLHLMSGVFIDRDYLPERHTEAPEFCWIPRRSDSEVASAT